MVTRILNATFDGVNDVNRLPGQSDIAWNPNSSRATIDRYSVYVETPDDLDATLNFTGSDWRIRMLQVAGEEHITRINDLDNGGNRRVEYLNLGSNSEVNLTSTKIIYMHGWASEIANGPATRHDVTLGSQNDWMDFAKFGADVNILDTAVGWTAAIQVYAGRGLITARGGVGHIGLNDENDRLTVDGGHVNYASLHDGNDRVIVRNDGRVNSLEAWQDTKTITVADGSRIDHIRGGDGMLNINTQGSGRIETLVAHNAHLNLTTADGWVSAITGHDTSSEISLGGGAGSIKFTSDSAQTHEISTAVGEYIGSIDLGDSRTNLNDDQSAVINLGWHAGTINLGNGDDRVTLADTDSWVGSIVTYGGDDVVNLGHFGAGFVHLTRGDDTVSVKKLADEQFPDAPYEHVFLVGGVGNDTISFADFGEAVEFTLLRGSIEQYLSGNDRAFIEKGFENLTGSAFNDKLIGDRQENILRGGNGNDELRGGGGDDDLIGGSGNDRLLGQNGKDMLSGGGGRDAIEGGASNDTMEGGGGADIFIFGANSGVDRILDWTDGVDTLRLKGHTGGFNDLNIFDQGANLRIDHDNGTILLAGQAGAMLTAADFDFA